MQSILLAGGDDPADSETNMVIWSSGLRLLASIDMLFLQFLKKKSNIVS